MSVEQFEIPILLLVFNRLDTTKQVFKSITKIKPKKLYIASDGHRNDVKGEQKKVADLRSYLIDNINWECEVRTLFRDNNLGCKYAVSSAITWFFENEEMGIILEDDCLPTQSFYNYCDTLLNYYKDDFRVGQISGFNQAQIEINKYDYFFTKYPMIWGWATWRSIWKKYCVEASLYDEVKKYKQLDMILSNCESKLRMNNIKNARLSNTNTWDYQWSLTSYINNFYTIIPSKNMIRNIGFGLDATHTNIDDPHLNLKVYNEFEIKKHPPYIFKVNEYENMIAGKWNFLKLIKMWIKKCLKD